MLSTIFKNFLIQGVPKTSIGSPKPQLLSKTFEISGVGRLFIADLVLFLRFEKF